MKRRLLAVLCVVVLAGLAKASVMVPEWSGSERTVLAEFDTWTVYDYDANGDYYQPDTFAASDRDALDTSDTWGVTADAYLDLSAGEYLESFCYHDDIIRLDINNGLDFMLANYVGGEFKEVWVEVTYYSCQDVIPVPDVWEAGADEYRTYAPTYWDMEVTADGWVTEAFSFIITPNPSWEVFNLNFETADSWDGYPVYVDSVIIETICVPEPATMVMLALGGVVTAIRRRK